MIQKESSTFPHPIEAGMHCAILHSPYTYDTLILLKGVPTAVSQLKILLYQFAAAMGLNINYNKSTAVTLHIREDIANQCTQILRCRKEGFPTNLHGVATVC
jgi:hypothetical protein